MFKEQINVPVRAIDYKIKKTRRLKNTKRKSYFREKNKRALIPSFTNSACK